jgi:hypothetical protein
MGTVHCLLLDLPGTDLLKTNDGNPSGQCTEGRHRAFRRHGSCAEHTGQPLQNRPEFIYDSRISEILQGADWTISEDQHSAREIIT